MVNVNVNQETVKRSYTIILINLTFEFVKVVHSTKGQERKKKRSNFMSKDISLHTLYAS